MKTRYRPLSENERVNRDLAGSMPRWPNDDYDPPEVVPEEVSDELEDL